MTQGLFVRVGACLVVCAVGCGGNTNSGSGGNGSTANCQTVTPCGGDVTGTWKIASVCEPPESADLGDGGACAGLSLQFTILDYEGTVTFSNGSYTSMLTKGTLGESLTEPTSCFGQIPAGTACSELSTALMQNDAGASGSCSLSGSNCVCSGTTMIGAQTGMGTYTTSDMSITLTDPSSGNGPQTGGYCVQGNTLVLSASAVSSTMSNMASGDLVLTKQ